MKFKHGIVVTFASAVLLAGCTTDKGEMKNYNEQIQKAFDEEKSITGTGKKLNELEQQKQKLVKDVNGKDEQKVKAAASKILDNVKERKSTFKKEEEAIDKSEQDYKKAGKHIDNIGNNKKQEEVQQLDDALKAKYQAHGKYAEAYNNVLDKEEDMFKYMSGDQIEQSKIDEKSKKVSKAYKEMDKQFKSYSKAMKKVDEEKKDVDNLI